jgi:hypothetical protein
MPMMMAKIHIKKTMRRITAIAAFFCIIAGVGVFALLLVRGMLKWQFSISNCTLQGCERRAGSLSKARQFSEDFIGAAFTAYLRYSTLWQ